MMDVTVKHQITRKYSVFIFSLALVFYSCILDFYTTLNNLKQPMQYLYEQNRERLMDIIVSPPMNSIQLDNGDAHCGGGIQG
jgi:hypothetical protein